jgi:hypothetical protein
MKSLEEEMSDQQKRQSMEMRKARSKHSGMSLEELRKQASDAEQAERNRAASRPTR